MPFFSTRYRSFNLDGTTALTQTRFKTYDASLTNAQAVAQYLALSPSQQYALSTDTEPTQNGYHKVLRRDDITVTDLGDFTA